MYYVYILTNKSNTVLYTGVTNDISRRITEHKNQSVNGFSKRYKTDKCVFVEVFNNVKDAIACEKKIKGGSRDKKFELIKSINPGFEDLSDKF